MYLTLKPPVHLQLESMYDIPAALYNLREEKLYKKHSTLKNFNYSSLIYEIKCNLLLL